MWDACALILMQMCGDERVVCYSQPPFVTQTTPQTWAHLGLLVLLRACALAALRRTSQNSQLAVWCLPVPHGQPSVEVCAEDNLGPQPLHPFVPTQDLKRGTFWDKIFATLERVDKEHCLLKKGNNTVRDLLQKIFATEPGECPPVTDIAKHPWLSGTVPSDAEMEEGLKKRFCGINEVPPQCAFSTPSTFLSACP